MKALNTIRVGTHATASDTTTVPSSWTKIEPEEDYSIPRTRDQIARPRQTGKNCILPPLDGARKASAKLAIELSGLEANVGQLVDADTINGMRPLLDNFFGPVVEEGNATTLKALAAGTVAATGTLRVTDPTAVDVGDGIMFAEGTSPSTTRKVARFVTAKAGDVLTLNAPFATGVIDQTRVYLGARWSVDQTHKRYPHIALTEQDADNTYRNDIYGCAVESVGLTLPGQGGRVLVDYSLRASHWRKAGDPDGPTIVPISPSTPARGKVVVSEASPLWLGGAERCYYAAGVTLTRTLRDRVCDGVEDGLNGYTHYRTAAVVEFTLRLGTAADEVGEAELASMELAAPRDLLLQVGEAETAAAAIWIPQASLVAVEGYDQGERVVKVTATATCGGSYADASLVVY